MNPVSILTYACHSVAGKKVNDYWNLLSSSQAPPSYSFSSISESLPGINSELTFLGNSLGQIWKQIQSETHVCSPSRLGIIFASTKGCIDDYIWNENSYLAHQEVDSISPILHSFLEKENLSPAVSICVSNACASSLSALFLGMSWIAQNRADQVLVFSADLAGPFVKKGFECLGALSETIPKPFSKDRDGLALGEAVTGILIGKTDSNFPFQIDSIGMNAEGYAVTRPSPSGESLKRAYQETNQTRPDLIIAHGTGTRINDIAEDQAFFDLFSNQVPVTGTKWAIGHTLGASGAMDVIAACEVLKHQKAFSLGTTQTIDPEFRSRYLSLSSEKVQNPIQNVLVSSLGFGGIHAVATIRTSKKTTQ